MSDSTMSIIMLVATLVLAGSAIFSVIVAWRTAGSAKKSIRLKAISELLGEYSSVEMAGYQTALHNAFEGDKRKETIDSFKNLWEKGDRSKINPEVDKARRGVAWYFTKVFVLHKESVLTESDIREDYLAKAETINDILLDKVEPLDIPGRGEKVYAFFRGLYTNKNEGRQ